MPRQPRQPRTPAGTPAGGRFTNKKQPPPGYALGLDADLDATDDPFALPSGTDVDAEFESIFDELEEANTPTRPVPYAAGWDDENPESPAALSAPGLLLDDEPEDPEEAADALDRSDQLRRAVARCAALSPEAGRVAEHYLALSLALADPPTIDQVAELAGLDAGVVSAELPAVLRSLRRSFTPGGDAPDTDKVARASRRALRYRARRRGASVPLLPPGPIPSEHPSPAAAAARRYRARRRGEEVPRLPPGPAPSPNPSPDAVRQRRSRARRRDRDGT